MTWQRAHRLVWIAVCALACEAQTARAPSPAPPYAAPEPKAAAAAQPLPEPPAEPKFEPPTESLAPQAPSPPNFGHADIDPSNDGVLGPPEPVADCHAQLDALGVTYKVAKLPLKQKHKGIYTCGNAQAVWVRHGPGDLRYSSSPLLSCGMAVALMDFERIVQQEAQRHLGTQVERIDFMSTYACRKMANYNMISEHSFANAIDIRRFRLVGGERVGVLEDFALGEASPSNPKARFLRAVANRSFDEQVFSTVLTPFFDSLHHNHFHLDLARYRVDGSRP